MDGHPTAGPSLSDLSPTGRSSAERHEGEGPFLLRAAGTAGAANVGDAPWLRITGGLPLLSIRDLASLLAVSEHTVRKWVACGPESGLVPKMLRINGQVRFRISDVEAFLIEREVA